MNQKYILPRLLAVFANKGKSHFSTLSGFSKTLAGRNPFRRSLAPLVLVASVFFSHSAFALSPIGSEDFGNDAYHSTVSEVRLVFFATDEHNHNVLDLKKDDFAVVDDENVIREFRSFTPSASIKLDVIVLIDSSDSVLPHFQQEITNVAQLISQSPWSPEDNVSAMSFAGLEAHLICSQNCRSSFAADQVVPGGAATPLLDAVETATTLLSQRRQPDVWPVIILFSDGDDTISKASFKDVQEEILATGAQIYAVDIGNSGRSSNHNATLQRLAADSGGRCVWLSEGASEIFSHVIDDLHSARVVTYALPQSNSAFHSVRILPTRNLNLQFRCRRGYYHRASSSEEAP
ncbi:MAG: VWA domain-containing protein [Candidatus Sulfotelmatobacter sp.]